MEQIVISAVIASLLSVVILHHEEIADAVEILVDNAVELFKKRKK